MNAFSPALTDFKKKYDTDSSTISIVFVASIGCYMVGALLCKKIFIKSFYIYQNNKKQLIL